MKIIILGTTQIGKTLAENLVSEKNDITVIDTDTEALRDLQNRFDIRTVRGLGSYPDILEEAQASDTDMLVAVTDSDEVNMLSCQVAYSLFNIPKKISRIRSPHYLATPDLYSSDNLPVDVCISPEQLVARYVSQLIERPGTLQVLDFYEGKVQLVAVRIRQGGNLSGVTLDEMEKLIEDFNSHVAAVFRESQAVPLSSDVVMQSGDEVFFISERSHVSKVLDAFGCERNRYKNIMIAGGGTIGFLVTKNLEDKFAMKVIETNRNRANYLAGKLEKATVLFGDATDTALLQGENIQKMDVFCALTNNDEDNIMSCLQAKKMGVPHVIALVARPAYADLIEGGDIDIIISPQHATISTILAHIRQGDVMNVHSLRRGAAEAIEVVVHGDEKTSNVVGRAICNIKMPEGANVGVIVRSGNVLVPHDDTVIEAEDHIIIFLTDKLRSRELEKLFQVKVTFI